MDRKRRLKIYKPLFWFDRPDDMTIKALNGILHGENDLVSLNQNDVRNLVTGSNCVAVSYRCPINVRDAVHYTKRLDAYTYLVIMLYAFKSHFDSIREITLGFKSHISRLNHLGINYIVHIIKTNYNIFYLQYGYNMATIFVSL